MNTGNNKLDSMKANIQNLRYGDKVASNRKENHFSHQYSVCAVRKGKIAHVLEARVYSTQAKNYACIWIHAGDEKYGSGGGNAGGYGYHRPSAAMQEALADAGVKLSEDIGGRGDSAMESALIAVGKALGYSNPTIIRAHG